MANSLKPVKIGADNIFAQTTRNSSDKKPGQGLTYAPRTKDFGRQNCSVPLASLESVPPALKDHAISPINHQAIDYDTSFKRSGSFSKPSLGGGVPEFNHGKSGP